MRAAGALEPDPAVRCPDDMAAEFLGGFNITTLAKRRATRRLWLWGADRKLPGSYTYEIARAKFIDEVVLAEVANGLSELILLGAGLDSRPYRLEERLKGTRVFEVDHPASLKSKRNRLSRLLDGEPSHVTFVETDFNRDDLEATMAAAGHQRSGRTLIVWSGVSVYLPESAVAGVLSWVGSHEAPRASIVFDAAWAGAVDGSRDYFGAEELRRRVAELGEPLRWGIPEDRAEETLSRYGLTALRVLDSEQMRTAYLKRSDGSLHHRPYGGVALIHASAG